MTRSFTVYIDDIDIPVAPSDIEIEIEGKNEAISLINGDEYNMIKNPKLTGINMVVRLPHTNDTYVKSYKEQQFYLDLFEKLKTQEDKRVFSVMVIRSETWSELSDIHFEYATLEDYKVELSSAEYLDAIVDLEFKKFIPLKAKKLTEEETINVSNKPAIPGKLDSGITYYLGGSSGEKENSVQVLEDGKVVTYTKFYDKEEDKYFNIDEFKRRFD